jgi:hypothetical protein
MSMFSRRSAIARREVVREIVRRVRGGDQNNRSEPTPAQVVRYARFHGQYVTEAEAREALAKEAGR